MNTRPLKRAQRCGCIKCTRKRRGYYDKKIKGKNVRITVNTYMTAGKINVLERKA